MVGAVGDGFGDAAAKLDAAGDAERLSHPGFGRGPIACRVSGVTCFGAVRSRWRRDRDRGHERRLGVES